MPRRFAVVVLAVGLLLVGYALFWAKSDEERIRECLDRLAEAVSTSEQAQNVLFRKAALDRAFKDVFVEDASARIPELAGGVVSGTHELALLAARGSMYFQSIELRFGSVSIDLGESAANVQALAKVSAERSGRLRQDERKVSFRFAKVGSDFRIESLSVSPETSGELAF